MNTKLILGSVFIAVCLGVLILSLMNSRGPNAINLAQQLNEYKSNGLPDFDLPVIANYAHARLRLSEVKSPIMFVNFWASWCAPCVQEIPSLKKLALKYPDKLTVLAITIEDNKDAALKFLKGESGEIPSNIIALHDDGGLVAQKLGTRKIPETYILDSGKKLLLKVVDGHDWMSESFSKVFAKFLEAP